MHAVELRKSEDEIKRMLGAEQASTNNTVSTSLHELATWLSTVNRLGGVCYLPL